MTSLSHQSSELIRFLKQPESYPHQPDQVKHVQTHASHVFIVPPYVYKIKKPVDFGFLSFDTLEKRHHYCHREVELNSRLCPEIYLGVVPISQTNGTYSFEATDDEHVIEYAVHMKKLSEEYLLSERVKNNSLTAAHLDQVADILAEFYRSQAPDPEVLSWGSVDKVKTNTDENFEQTEQFIGQTITEPAYEAIRHYTDGYLSHHAALFQKRIEEQRIVDGHGDLHLEHIHVTPERVCIYDCIEFNNRFRYQDTACDLAYLAMDLDFHGLWQLSKHFADCIAPKLDDTDLVRVINFYKCYRAYVKGKVKSLQSEQAEETDSKEALISSAIRYFNLSLRYALLGSRPFALIFIGQPGSGKSTLARETARQLNIELLSSDHIRKTLGGLPVNRRTPESKREQIYSAEMTARTYSELWHKAINCLRTGQSVALDATFSNRTDRQAFVTRFQSHKIHFCFVETKVPGDVIRQRLADREHRQDIISDARLEDFEKLHNRYDPPEEIEPDHLIQVSTRQPVDQSLKLLYLQLAGLNLNQS